MCTYKIYCVDKSFVFLFTYCYLDTITLCAWFAVILSYSFPCAIMTRERDLTNLTVYKLHGEFSLDS